MMAIPGLSAQSNKIVEDILNRFPQSKPFVLFGSRAKGCFRNGSDIDIAAKGECSKDDLSNLLAAFDDSMLPYYVDVLAYNRIANSALKAHIDSVGMMLNK